MFPKKNDKRKKSVNDLKKNIITNRKIKKKKTHQDWGTSQCNIKINDKQLETGKKTRKNLSAKQYGYKVVKPLDISEHADNSIEITLDSNSTFQGAMIVEIVDVIPVQEIVRRVMARSIIGEIQNKDHPLANKCIICSRVNSTLRCSRCKCAWYCGQTHQKQDWPFHQTICRSAEGIPRLPETKKNENAIMVSQEGKVDFSEKKENMLCQNLCVDYKMVYILKNTADNIDFVILYTNDVYQVITIQDEDKCIRKKTRSFFQINIYRYYYTNAILSLFHKQKKQDSSSNIITDPMELD
ncbi:hypothetical protein RFI_22439 [Reticulomyxa filosa]|uniref:MYND-type domain-containing protein n=1 Tax=Reticulomyxa filosa TaxID=46433 RepID=X6MLQ8_RETFI|nr:hypothetical protein RFI_22439 [Reticulomyxa filosa]|eukprot:ETO14928.1 hypothetical protein RFI_22439 [Reticulomyxa filosa]